MIKPINTLYRGFYFRSRLEARWAVFFDGLGVKWEYEVEGFDLGAAGWYLPDFWLPDLGFYMEVKPSSVDPYDIATKMPMIGDWFDGSPALPLVVVSGHPWEYRSYENAGMGICDEGAWAACPECKCAGFVYAGWAGYITGCSCWGPRDDPSKGYKVDGTKSPSMIAAIGVAKAARFEYGACSYTSRR